MKHSRLKVFKKHWDSSEPHWELLSIIGEAWNREELNALQQFRRSQKKIDEHQKNYRPHLSFVQCSWFHNKNATDKNGILWKGSRCRPQLTKMNTKTHICQKKHLMTPTTFGMTFCGQRGWKYHKMCFRTCTTYHNWWYHEFLLSKNLEGECPPIRIQSWQNRP